MSQTVRLEQDNVEVLVDVSTGAPTIVYWGPPLGPDADPASLGAALDRPIAVGELDVVAPISLVPEHGSGFTGRPGLLGRRGGGRAWSPRFSTLSFSQIEHRLTVDAVDEAAGLALTTSITLDHVLRITATLENIGDRRYSLDQLTLSVPLPEYASDLLAFEGRWAREFHPVRRDWTSGSFTAENRAGRTSHEHPPLMFAGRPGFGEWNGDVWGVHIAWSGNHQMSAERLADGRRYIQGGELLHPGEVVLEPGDTYTTPDLVGVCSSQGLTPASWGFHRAIRAYRHHPTEPRPVVLNTWEAVYFDHDITKLRELAATAAELGVERFVLDDGWFGSRRDDTSGLGDWTVSSEVYPDGLGPLIEHVRGLGMQFGIWVEPEMVNPDSDVYRAHPEWVLTTDGYDAITGRHQLVLDLAHDGAFDHVLGQLDALLRDHDISFVKWDMNRAHVQGSGSGGAAGTHAQTRTLYRLLDELRSRHPDVEIESCASGGARIDHEILRRTERVWTSDCNDALERQTIQRGASMLIPPEVMGAHIGPRRSHTTGRTQSLAFRGTTAIFGHLGIEWDVTSLTDSERSRLAGIVDLHRRHRHLLHDGDTVRFDTDDSVRAHGVYSVDRTEAIVSFAQLTTGPSLTPAPLQLPGLEPDARYRVEHLAVPGERLGAARSQTRWFTEPGGVVLTGRQLASHGIQPPTLHPESAVLFFLSRL